ncbi:putative Dehydrogenase/reductase SDR family member 4 [Triangularia setosa]|uniref:Dehydrogenase/reductase SDR family member 4 n=1 Tax=Triangularia setosa TaxID=2587417 RepID=A0AAN6W2V6_9PEZI|nr:putative Dehydrogenase/reductase SDR family member 4 [Podospora setosa]
MTRANKLAGKKIAVIGGSSGIGYGAAEILLEAGAHVTVISSTQDKVDHAVQQLSSSAGGNVQGRVGDVRDEDAFTKLLLSLAPLDHVVFSSVDKIIRGSLADANLTDAASLFGVKFWGSFVVSKAISKHGIVVPGGSLTLTSGAAALRPKKGATIGGALNGGLITATVSLADELSPKRIRVNTVVPGLVKTPLLGKLGNSDEQQKEIYDQAAQRLSVGFVASPEHVAEAYLYAVRADYANGSTIVIDGGGSF